MNLNEEKKGPLRLMPMKQKRVMLEKFFQSKGTGRVQFLMLLGLGLLVRVRVGHCCSAMLFLTVAYLEFKEQEGWVGPPAAIACLLNDINFCVSGSKFVQILITNGNLAGWPSQGLP